MTVRGIAAHLSSYVSVSQGCLLSHCQLLAPFLFLYSYFLPFLPPSATHHRYIFYSVWLCSVLHKATHHVSFILSILLYS